MLRARQGALDLPAAQAVLRDRRGPPHALCRAAGDAFGKETATVVSLIARPAERRLWVAPGPPHLHAYRDYTLGA